MNRSYLTPGNSKLTYVSGILTMTATMLLSCSKSLMTTMAEEDHSFQTQGTHNDGITILESVPSQEVPNEVLVADTEDRSSTDAYLDSISPSDIASIERRIGLNASEVTTVYRIPGKSYKYGFRHIVKLADQPDLFTKKALFGKSSSNVKRIIYLAKMLIPIISFTRCVPKSVWGLNNNFMSSNSIHAYSYRANQMSTIAKKHFDPFSPRYFQRRSYYLLTKPPLFNIDNRYRSVLFSSLSLMDELGHGDLVLETNRLLLRKPCEHDAASMFEYASNRNVSRYTNWENHKNIEDSKAFIKRSSSLFGKDYRVGPFMLLKKCEPDKVIGTVSCFSVSHTDKCMELALAICEKNWGLGIATEASKEVINYAFSHFDLERLQFRCATENKASLALALRLGFLHEGVLRHSMWSKGRYWNINFLSILRTDWIKNNTSSSSFLEKKL